MQLKDRNVVWSLEGAGKSSKVFQLLREPDSKILFGFKNYALMVEQMYSWSERFKVPLSEFVIAGNNQTYGPALQAYTNPEKPFEIPKKAKYVFTTQSQIQKLGHLDFICSEGLPVKYDHIVIDEFDFCIGCVPSLDYQLKHLATTKDIKEITEKNIIDWVYKNYTKIDARRLLISKDLHFEGFNKAYWLEASNCPITFLTSEVLAARFLNLLGFNLIELESQNVSDCTVNIWSSNLLGRNFFNKMNTYVGWNKLNYNAIISDSINSYFERNKNEESLEVTTLSHTATRGRNDLIGSKILTVLSYIPSQAIRQIQEAFIYFGDEDITYQDVETLFYRDRLCQAVGRVIGNRGGKTTDVITHTYLLDTVKQCDDFPYKINTNWEFNFNGFDEILDKVKQAEKVRKEKVRKMSVKDYSFVKDLFELSEDPNNFIPVESIKIYLEKLDKKIPASKIAAFFEVPLKNKRVGGTKEVKKCIFGIDFKLK